uniref:Theileria-specific sub-telomeric protein, SVSP family, putative n=1 Tax=Theileria annulata TaxID=5874 RepID=A0A3B0MMH3_THEAN
MDFVTYIYIIVLLLLQSNECADKTTQEQNKEGQYDPVTLEQYGPESEPQPILYYVPHYQFQPQPDQQLIPVYYGPQYQPQYPYQQPSQLYQPQEQQIEPTPIPQPQQPYQPTPPQYYTGYQTQQPVPYQEPPPPEQLQPYYPGPQYPVQQQYYPGPQYQPVPQYYPPPQPQEYQLPQQGIGYHGPQYQPVPQYYPGYQPQPQQYPQSEPQYVGLQPIQPQIQQPQGPTQPTHQPQPYYTGPPTQPTPQPQPYYTGPPTQPTPQYGPQPYQPIQHPLPQPRQTRGPQSQPRPTAPLRQPSNLRPSILGPGPGPFRYPPQLLQNLRHQHIGTPRQPTKQPIQQPIQFTEEPTQQPTQHTAQTQATQEPTGLHPETIPVEIGSDDDEEPPKPPKGPGDGDQPPDKADEGEDEDEDDEDEDEEEKKPSKDVKICNTITFMKKNSEGNLVPMSEGDYTVISYSEYNIKYVFNAELEAVLCDQETIFTHLAGRDYCKSVIHKRHHGSFNFRRDDGFVLVKFKNGKWKFRARNNPDYVRLYALDNEGKEIELDEKSYYLKFTSSGSFKYEFLQNVRLTKFIIKDKVVWEKTITDDHPSAVAVTERFNAIIYFDTYTRVYGRRKGRYRFLFTRPNIKYIKK